MKSIKMVLMAGCLSMFFTNCVSPEPKSIGEQSFEKVKSTENAINLFENERYEGEESLTYVYYKIDTIFQNFDHNNPEAPILEFEQVWLNMVSEVNQLNRYYNNVYKRANDLFLFMDIVAKEMNDERNREEELRMNQRTKDEFDKVLAEARLSLQKIQKTIDMGDDQFRKLLLASLRNSLNQEVKALKGITMDAHNIIEELKKLSEEGTMILRISYEDDIMARVKG